MQGESIHIPDGLVKEAVTGGNGLLRVCGVDAKGESRQDMV